MINSILGETQGFFYYTLKILFLLFIFDLDLVSISIMMEDNSIYEIFIEYFRLKIMKFIQKKYLHFHISNKK